MKNKIFVSLLVSILSPLLHLQAQDPGEKLFTQKCMVCHTIGRGDLVGPDLANVTTRRTESWISKFVISPQSVINSGDSTATALFKKYKVVMPDQQLSSNEIKSLLTYIDAAGSSAKGNSPLSAFDFVSTNETDIELGRKYFEGTIRFSNGGPACLSCHNIDNASVFNGGLLAKDLTNVFSRYPSSGVGGILTSPPFPAMIDAFGNTPLTTDEINALLAFLNHTNKSVTVNNLSLNAQFDLLLEAIVILNFIFILFFIFWSRVKKNSVHSK